MLFYFHLNSGTSERRWQAGPMYSKCALGGRSGVHVQENSTEIGKRTHFLGAPGRSAQDVFGMTTTGKSAISRLEHVNGCHCWRMVLAFSRKLQFWVICIVLGSAKYTNFLTLRMKLQWNLNCKRFFQLKNDNPRRFNLSAAEIPGKLETTTRYANQDNAMHHHVVVRKLGKTHTRCHDSSLIEFRHNPESSIYVTEVLLRPSLCPQRCKV